MKIVKNYWGWTPKHILKWIRYSWAIGLHIWYVENPSTKCYKFLCFCWKHSIKQEKVTKKCPICGTINFYYHDGLDDFICKNNHTFKKPIYKI